VRFIAYLVSDAVGPLLAPKAVPRRPGLATPRRAE
jgi:hypothetical protein